MTAFTDRFSGRAWEMLQEEHGESVTRYPLGDESAGASVSGVIVSLGREDAKDMQLNRDEKGKRIIRHGLLTLSVSVEVDDRDTWLIRSERWKTIRVKGRDAATQHVEIRRVIPIDTSKPRVSKFA